MNEAGMDNWGNMPKHEDDDKEKEGYNLKEHPDGTVSVDDPEDPWDNK